MPQAHLRHPCPPGARGAAEDREPKDLLHHRKRPSAQGAGQLSKQRVRLCKGAITLEILSCKSFRKSCKRFRMSCERLANVLRKSREIFRKTIFLM